MITRGPRPVWPVLAAFAALLLALAPVGGAGEDAPRIPGVSTSVERREVHVSARLRPGLPADVEQRLASGLPTTTVWRIRLFVFRNLWFFDGLKDERRYAVTATYRPETGDYRVERRLDEKLLDTRVAATREDAEGALSEVPALPCFILGDHLLGKRLVVRVSCSYRSGVALGLLPTTVETDWTRSGIFDWPERGSR